MLKKLFIIFLLLALLSAGGAYLLRRLATTTTPPSVDISNQLPEITTSSGKLVFKESGGTVEVADFTSNTTTTVDGQLLFSDPIIGSIYYNPDGRSFRLFAQPEFVADFRANRPILEQKLLSILQISEDDVCKLAVFFNVSSPGNDSIDGAEVGLSFCPNAVPTP